MIDQYFGVKELYEVVLRAKTPMTFGTRYIEENEPVLYFENISMSTLSERNQPIMARGGWANMPRVIWEDRSEVQFTFSEGVMSSISMGILLSSQVVSPTQEKKLFVSKREGPKPIDEDTYLLPIEHWPVDYPLRKTFVFEYERGVAQKKVYCEKVEGQMDPFGVEIPSLRLFEDKEHKVPIEDIDKKFLVDYYYQYNNEALIYNIQKERFNGLFTLEGKFYSKDENKGYNYTNLMYMPKVRVVSDINLRLGERADPSVSVFNIIGLPENTDGVKNLILEITRLNENLDEEDDL